MGCHNRPKRAAWGYRNTENFIAIAYLRLSKPVYLPTSPFEATRPRSQRFIRICMGTIGMQRAFKAVSAMWMKPGPRNTTGFGTTTSKQARFPPNAVQISAAQLASPPRPETHTAKEYPLKRWLLASSLLIALSAQAKLTAPVLDVAAQAKAAETKAKADHDNKIGAHQLCAVQDRLAAYYGNTSQAAAAAVPCVNPGPFVFAAAEQKPAEAAGAHSPAATAVSPPSTKVPAAAKGS